MSRFLRRKTPLIAGFLFLIVVGGFIAIRAVERNSWLFFDTGKAIVNHLGSMAVQLQAGQVEELESFFPPTTGVGFWDSPSPGRSERKMD